MEAFFWMKHAYNKTAYTSNVVKSMLCFQLQAEFYVTWKAREQQQFDFIAQAILRFRKSHVTSYLRMTFNANFAFGKRFSILL